MGRKKKPPGDKSVNRVVSLPADMQEEMQEWPDENWSYVAQRAFRVRLGELANAKERKVKEDVISRLKGLKIEEESETYNDGCDLGRFWAENSASPAQLSRLEKFKESMDYQSPGWSTGWFELDSGPGSTRDILACEIQAWSLQHRDERDFEDFWYTVFGDDEEAEKMLDDATYLRGFADGALDVWGDVKDHI